MALGSLRPDFGAPIQRRDDGTLQVPDAPLIPFIEGDGVGVDVMPVMRQVLDAAVDKAYRGRRRLAWMEVLAGDKAVRQLGPDQALPESTVEALRTHLVSIKGPLATPVAGGLRSLNVRLRQALDLYVCLRPIKHYAGVPSPLREPERTDLVIFRENSEDLYAGIEWEAGSAQARRVIDFLQAEMGVGSIRFPDSSAIGVKPVSREGTERLVRQAIRHAIEHDLPSVTLVHKGNIMKFTEGGFRDWGYALAQREFGATPIDGGPWCRLRHPRSGREILIKDALTDAFLQQVLMRPADFSVIATMNLNGDYLSDALAAHVGGLGIAPGANLSDQVACFEATHGTAPRYAGKDYVNPGSAILSGVMMLRHLGWVEAAGLVTRAMEMTIASRHVTYDFARLMEGAVQVSCSGFGARLIEHLREDL